LFIFISSNQQNVSTRSVMFKVMRFIVIAVLVAIAVGAALEFFNPNSEPPANGQRPGWMQR